MSLRAFRLGFSLNGFAAGGQVLRPHEGRGAREGHRRRGGQRALQRLPARPRLRAAGGGTVARASLTRAIDRQI